MKCDAVLHNHKLKNWFNNAGNGMLHVLVAHWFLEVSAKQYGSMADTCQQATGATHVSGSGILDRNDGAVAELSRL